jgi:hypothetical protein
MRSGEAGDSGFRGIWGGRAPHNSNRGMTAARICALSPSRVSSTVIGGVDPEA